MDVNRKLGYFRALICYVCYVMYVMKFMKCYVCYVMNVMKFFRMKIIYEVSFRFLLVRVLHWLTNIVEMGMFVSLCMGMELLIKDR